MFLLKSVFSSNFKRSLRKIKPSPVSLVSMETYYSFLEMFPIVLDIIGRIIINID